MSPFDFAFAFLLVAGISFVVGRFTAPKTLSVNTVNVTLPNDSTVLAGLDLDDPVIKTATQGAAFRARVWLATYQAAADNGSDYPDDVAENAVDAIFR